MNSLYWEFIQREVCPKEKQKCFLVGLLIIVFLITWEFLRLRGEALHSFPSAVALWPYREESMQQVENYFKLRRLQTTLNTTTLLLYQASGLLPPVCSTLTSQGSKMSFSRARKMGYARAPRDIQVLSALAFSEEVISESMGKNALHAMRTGWRYLPSSSRSMQHA